MAVLLLVCIYIRENCVVKAAVFCELFHSFSDRVCVVDAVCTLSVKGKLCPILCSIWFCVILFVWFDSSFKLTASVDNQVPWVMDAKSTNGSKLISLERCRELACSFLTPKKRFSSCFLNYLHQSCNPNYLFFLKNGKNICARFKCNFF